MLGTLNPLGERARGNSYWNDAVVFGSTATLAGLGWGFLAGIAGEVLLAGVGMETLSSALWVAACATTVLEVAHAARGGGRILISPSRQVNERWLYALKGWAYAGGFGLQLGVGFVTVINSWMLVLALIAALSSKSPILGAAIGILYGGIRGASVLLVSSVATSSKLSLVVARMEHTRRPVQLALAIAALLALGFLWIE